MLQTNPIEIGVIPELEGTFTSLEVFEDTPTNTSHVIRRNESWGVNLKWEINSDIPNNPHNHLLLANEFVVSVFLEGYGPGANEFKLPPPNGEHIVLWGTGGTYVDPLTRTWSTSISFTSPAVDIPVGLYMLSAMLTLRTPGPQPVPLQAAGFIEGPIVQFY